MPYTIQIGIYSEARIGQTCIYHGIYHPDFSIYHDTYRKPPHPVSELCEDLPGLEAGDITALLHDLPIPIQGDIPEMKVEEAIEVRFCIYKGIYHGIYQGTSILLDILYC
jgi:hypothetical protein